MLLQGPHQAFQTGAAGLVHSKCIQLFFSLKLFFV
jgi:hypothetical protein